MQEISTVGQVPTTGTVLLYVGTSWCAYCAKTIAAIGEIMPAHPQVALYKIDGDEEPDILTEVGAKSYPQLLLFREGARIAQRESADAPALAAWLAEHGIA